MVLFLTSNPSFILTPQYPRLRASNSKPTSYLKSTNATYLETRRCDCIDLHKEVIHYKRAEKLQKSIVEKKLSLIDLDEDFSDSLIVFQHLPVYTLGTGSSEKYLKFDRKDPPHEVYRTRRGGEVTYHGPGQLVLYPIMNLRYHKMDTSWYLRRLEEVVIRVLCSTFSIKASRSDGLFGVWVGNQKLAALGVSAPKWVTRQGLALNVTTDLSPFQHIVPCGIPDGQVGSIKGLLDGPIDDSELLDITYKSLLREFFQVFQLDVHMDLSTQYSS